MKLVVINADDFGFTRDVNAGIIKAHREGVLTSATIMANGEAFEDAVRLWRETPTLDVGCHLALVGGQSLATGKPLPRSPRDLLFALAARSLNVREELRLQMEKIVESGIRPTHLDTHKHTHLVPAVFREVVRLAREFAVPYVRLSLDRTVRIAGCSPVWVRRFYERDAASQGVLVTDHFLGFRLTGSLTVDSFGAAIPAIQEGTTEFMCHPGLLGPELSNASTRLKESRVRELDALTSPRIRELLIRCGVELVSFAGLAKRMGVA